MAVSKVAPPHISIEKTPGTEPGVGVGDAQHVAGAHPRRQQRLMGVAKRGVGHQERLLVAHPARERVGAHGLEPLARAVGGGSASESNAGGSGSATVGVPGRPRHARESR